MIHDNRIGNQCAINGCQGEMCAAYRGFIGFVQVFQHQRTLLDNIKGQTDIFTGSNLNGLFPGCDGISIGQIQDFDDIIARRHSRHIDHACAVADINANHISILLPDFNPDAGNRICVGIQGVDCSACMLLVDKSDICSHTSLDFNRLFSGFHRIAIGGFDLFDDIIASFQIVQQHTAIKFCFECANHSPINFPDFKFAAGQMLVQGVHQFNLQSACGCAAENNRAGRTCADFNRLGFCLECVAIRSGFQFDGVISGSQNPGRNNTAGFCNEIADIFAVLLKDFKHRTHNTGSGRSIFIPDCQVAHHHVGVGDNHRLSIRQDLDGLFFVIDEITIRRFDLLDDIIASWQDACFNMTGTVCDIGIHHIAILPPNLKNCAA